MRRREFVRRLGAGGLAGFGLVDGGGRPGLAGVGASPDHVGFTSDGRAEVSTGSPQAAARGLQVSAQSPEAAARIAEAATRIVILHTNDTHSRLDPFPMDGGPFQGLGGAARRAALVRRVRDAHEHVLLVDSGDIFQGTPYFNFFGGSLEFRAMTAMGYDVATLGNHDFDAGVDGLVRVLPEAGFEFVSANYDVAESELAEHVRPWTIRDYGGVRVGVFGLGIAFERLVLASLHEGVRYTDPIAAARLACRELRARGCALVVCLSHLGYRYLDDRPSDRALAAAVPDIDVVLGGHTHSFMDEPEVFAGGGPVERPEARARTEAPARAGGGRDPGQAGGQRSPGQGRTGFTLVHQVGWGGMRLGRIDVAFGDDGGASGWSAGRYEIDGRLD